MSGAANQPTDTAPLNPPVPPTQGQPERPAPAAPPRSRALLLVTGALLAGWFAWLSYTALTKSRAPVVSRAQASAAKVPVRATLATGRDDLRANHSFVGPNNVVVQNLLVGKAERPAFAVTVTEQLHPSGPAVGEKIAVRNLCEASGYTGHGDYLLLLVRDGDATIDGAPAYVLAGIPRSVGGDGGDGVAPLIYPWTEAHAADLRKQVKRLFP
jgi:hypothetical protein